MCTVLILHGNLQRESNLAKQIMDASGVEYRFEGGGDPQEPPTLITPGGRYRGLEAIRSMFGRDMEALARRQRQEQSQVGG
jgi:hypothetical protein